MTSNKPGEPARLRNDAEYMQFLIAAGELLSSSLDYRSTLRNLCAAAVQSIADICILDVGSIADAETVGAAHRDTSLSAQLKEASSHFTREEGRPAHPVCKVLDSGQTFFAPAIDEAWISTHASSKAHAEFMRRMKFRSMIIVPVRSQIWGLTGALTLVRTDRSPEPYDEQAIAFARDLGRRCGIAIGKARLHSQTIDIAERLQKAALPRSLPASSDIRFDALYEPADAALLVGGDWYDAFELKNGNIGISIGDVSGHGIEAAAQMSCIRNAIRMALVMETDLNKVLADADFLFRNEAPKDTFCTALVAVIDKEKGIMQCASAGHPGPLIWTRGSVTSPLREKRPPLAFGDLTPASGAQSTIALEPGCTIVFYTDGLIEAQRNAPAGEENLRRALLDPAIRNDRHPARALRDACVQGAHSDDIAVLVMRYERNR